MDEADITPAEEELRLKGIPFRAFQHDGEVRSLEQAAQERDQLPEQVVRSIVFRISEGSYLMVLIAGPGQIDWRSLRRYLGESRLTMASTEEVLRETGYEPGAVTPFGLPRPMRLLVDQSVFDQQTVSLGSGRRSYALIMDRDALRSALPPYESSRFGQA